MSKQRIFVVTVFVLLFTCIFPPEEGFASTHELEALDIHVFIEEDGSAVITERRTATLSEGTENYIVIGNLGASTITDFQVYEDGKQYEYVDDWDLDWTREQKAFKNGLIKEEDHYELVWGIGEYGEHEYELTYTVTDFIKQLEDSQMIFWQFINTDMNIPPQQVTVTIESDQAFTQDNERIWAFGYDGDIHFRDGKVVAENSSPLSEKDYVTILTELPDSNFGTNDVLDQTFEEIKEQAFEGSDYESENFFVTLFKIILIPVSFLGGLILIFSLITRRDKKKLKKAYEGKYYREIPYNGDFYHAYAVLTMDELSDLKRVLSAFILHWINEGRITVIPALRKGIFRNKEVIEFHLSADGLDGLEGSEAELFNFFLEASKDGVLKQRDFKRWSKKNRKRVSKWEGDLVIESLTKFEEDGFLEREEYELDGKVEKKNVITAKTLEFKDNTYMFMNYLNDFSLLNEREPVNVKLWDELMIWAAMLGLTDVVYKQIKELYPAYEQESKFSNHTIRTAAVYSRSMHTPVSFYRGSGSGGSASSGGGSGSFGGGSGGGTR